MILVRISTYIVLFLLLAAAVRLTLLVVCFAIYLVAIRLAMLCLQALEEIQQSKPNFTIVA